MADSPTKRSLALLRNAGATCQVVEHWNAFARRRIDLFGVIDIVVLAGGKIIGVQTTSGDNVSKRLAKMREEPAVRKWLECGGLLEVHGWAKRGARGEVKRWNCRVVPVTLDVLAEVDKISGPQSDNSAVPKHPLAAKEQEHV